MKAFGYSQNVEKKNDLLTMREICLQLTLDEIDELIDFFKFVRKRHSDVSQIAYMPHTHYSEWKNLFGQIEPEIIISTVFPQNPPIHIDLLQESEFE